MKRIVLVALTLGCLLLLAPVAEAGLLPGRINAHYKGNLIGFGVLNDTGVNLQLRSVSAISSPFQWFGDIPAGGQAEFQVDTSPSGVDHDITFPGIAVMFMRGYELFRVDQSPSPGVYIPHVGYAAAKLYLAGGAGNNDIMYFGADPNAAVTRAEMWHDPIDSLADLAKGGIFNADNQYTVGGKTFGVGDTAIVAATTQSIATYQIDGIARYAPAGTLVANIVGTGAAPVFYMDVVPGWGSDWQLIVPGAMKDTGVFIDPAVGGGTVTLTADLIAASQATVPTLLQDENLNWNYWTDLTDPLEWVSQPEPSSLLVWGGLALLVCGYCKVRRRR